MSIFALNSLKFVYNMNEADFRNTPLAEFYSFSKGKIAPKKENFSGATVETHSANYYVTFKLPGFSDVSINFNSMPRFYTAETAAATIFGYGTTEKFYAYHAFISGKKANITETDEQILVVRFKYDTTDKTYIYASDIPAGEQLTSGIGNTDNKGLCDKFLLSPMTYNGIVAANAYTVDGGMDDLSEGVCKIDGSFFYKLAENIAVKVDELIK